MRTIGRGEGVQPGQMKSPGGVAVDKRGRLLVSECSGRRIQVFSLAGEPLQVCWPTARAQRPVNLRSICCQDDGRAYVADFANHRVAVLRLFDS